MKRLVLDISVRYLSRTYTLDPVFPAGEWKCEGSAKFCDNYRIEMNDVKNGFVTKVWFTNTDAKPVKLRDIAFAGRWQAPVEACITYEWEDQPFMMYNVMGSPVRTHKLLPMEKVAGCDLIPLRDVTGDCGVLGFATNERYFSNLEIDSDGKFLVTQNLENRVVEPGDTIESDWFYIGDGETTDEALGTYMDTLAEYSHLPELPKEMPTGWCTWYYYLGNIYDRSIRENMAVLSANRERLPVKYVQIDDGWFENWGDWVPNEKFPEGMKAMADEIRSQGFVPGIWLCPFSASSKSKTAAEHPNAMVQNPDGSGPAGGHNWAIDPTNPEGEKILREVFHRLSYDWGYRYIKMDYMISGVQPGKRYDPKASTMSSMRRGLEIIRESVTPDTFLLACTSPTAVAMGLCEGMRVSCDIGSSWESLKEVCQHVLKRYFYHGKAYLNDPDCLLLRESDEEDDECMRLCKRKGTEHEVFMTAVAACGGIFMMSDKLPLLKDEKLDWLFNMIPVNTRAAVPLDILDTDIPGVLDFGDYGDIHVAALINWSDFDRDMTLPASCIGGRKYGFEYWRKEKMTLDGGALTVKLPPHSAKLYWFADHPIEKAEKLIPQA